MTSHLIHTSNFFSCKRIPSYITRIFSCKKVPSYTTQVFFSCKKKSELYNSVFFFRVKNFQVIYSYITRVFFSCQKFPSCNNYMTRAFFLVKDFRVIIICNMFSTKKIRHRIGKKKINKKCNMLYISLFHYFE